MNNLPTQHERIIEYIRREYNRPAEYLWARYPRSCIFRNAMNRKWFAAVLDVARSHVGLPGDGIVYMLNLKCSPDILATILPRDKFLPAYHMNKNTWTSIPLDDRLPDAQIYPLISASWDNTAPRVRVKKK